MSRWMRERNCTASIPRHTGPPSSIRQTGWAPDQPDTLDAEGFFEAYYAEATYESIHYEIEDSARSQFDSQEWDEDKGEEPEYETLDEVPRDTIHRARIYENGDVDFFACSDDHRGPAAIGNDETPIMQLSRAQIYAAFGVDNPLPAPEFEPGEYRTVMTFILHDEEQFREDFAVEDGANLSTARLQAILFLPADSGDLGGELTGVEVEVHGKEIEATLVINVTNPELLMLTAARNGRETGRDSDYIPENITDAIFENWLGANDGGSVLDYGIEHVANRPGSAPDTTPAPDL